MSLTVRLIDDEAPQRAPDGEVDGAQGQFYFWLGDDGVENDPNYDSMENDMSDGGSSFEQEWGG